MKIHTHKVNIFMHVSIYSTVFYTHCMIANRIWPQWQRLVAAGVYILAATVAAAAAAIN